MKKFLFVVLLLCVLAVGGVATLVVMSFNPGSYEKQVIAALQKLTGREVKIGGATSIQWNPMPTITLNDLRLSNIDKSAEADMLTIERVRVVISWASLLKTPFEIKRIELTRPQLLLERLENNRSNFAFPFLIDPQFKFDELSVLDGNNGTPLPQTRIDTLVIQDGSIHYVNRVTASDITLSDLGGTLSADTVRGPFAFTGRGTLGNKQYDIQMTSGRVQSETAVPVSLNLTEQTMGLNLALTGDFTPVKLDKWLQLSGSFSTGDVNALTDTWGLPALVSRDRIPASGSLTLELAPMADSIRDFSITLGTGETASALTGTIEKSLTDHRPKYRVSVAFNRLDRNLFAGYLSYLNWSSLSGEKTLPDITFDLLLETVPMLNGEAKKVQLAGEFANGFLTVDKSSAQLPGETVIQFMGKGGIVEQTPTLDLDIRGETKEPATLLTWLTQGTFNGDKRATVKHAEISGRMRLTPDMVRAAIKQMRLDDTRISGSVVRTLDKNGGYEIKLALSDINFDTFTGWQPPENGIAISTIPERVRLAFERAEWLNNQSVQALLEIRNGTVFGTPFARGHVQADVNKNVLRVEQLNLTNMAGANISMAGLAKGLGSPQAGIDVFRLSLTSKKLSQLMQQMKLNTGLPLIQNAGASKLRLDAKSGADNIWQIAMQSVFSEAAVKMSGQIDTAGNGIMFKDMSFDITHPNFHTFMAGVAPDFKGLAQLDGTFKFKGTFSGHTDHFELKDFTGGVGLQQMNGDLTFENGKVKNITAVLASPMVDVERFASGLPSVYSPVNGFLPKPFDFKALDTLNWDIRLTAGQLLYRNTNIRQAEVHSTLQNKELRLVKLTGRAGTAETSAVQMTGKLDWNTTPNMQVSFHVQNMPLRSDFLVLPDFAFGGGSVSVRGDLTARGVSPADFVRSLDGKGNLQILGGQMIGVSAEQMIPLVTRAIQRGEAAKVFEPEFKRVLNSGKTVLQSIGGDFVVAGGVVRMMDLTLKTANTTANPMQIVWDIPKRTFDVSIPVVLNPINTLPPFILGISAGTGKGQYQANFDDLSLALTNNAQNALETNLRQQQKAAQQAANQKRSERLAESRSLTQQARSAVSQMEQQLKAYPNEQGTRLLQAARDALSIVNQLAVREEPTDAQLIQVIEQARTVLLKQQEFSAVLQQDTVFSARKQVNTDLERARQMTESLTQWAMTHPEIEILPRLADNARQNLTLMEQETANLSATTTPDETQRILSVSADAVAKIEKAYRHAARFDLGADPALLTGKTAATVVPAAGTSQTVQKSTVRGRFSRAN